MTEQTRKVVVPVWLRVPAHADIGEVGDDDLVAECKRRGYVVLSLGREVVLPGLRVPADRAAATWRGVETALTVTEHAFLRVLAAAYPTALTHVRLALVVWGDAHRAKEVAIYTHGLRRRLPGLLRGCKGGPGSGVGGPVSVTLDLPEDDAEPGAA